MKRIDFYATQPHYIDHQLPVWRSLPADIRGRYFLGRLAFLHGKARGLDEAILLDGGLPEGDSPILTSSYGDIRNAFQGNQSRPIAYLDHGVGFALPHPAYSGYEGGKGLYREKVDLFLAPNEPAAINTEKGCPNALQVIVGTPKLDRWAGVFDNPKPKQFEKPVVAISFHWNAEAVIPEAGNALRYFRGSLRKLAVPGRPFMMMGHGHPRFMDNLEKIYRENGFTMIERNFDRVMDQADLYINDASSTMYEFLVTGKPVIIMNSPRYRRKARFGVRFWDYTDIGHQVNDSQNLLFFIKKTLEHPEEFREQRRKAINDLYPFLGHSAKLAATVLSIWTEYGRDELAYHLERQRRTHEVADPQSHGSFNSTKWDRFFPSKLGGV